MRTVEISGKKVEIYDNIEELPIIRFHKYNKCLLIDSGVGGDIGGFDMRLEKIIRFIGVNKEDAIKELQNLRQCVYLIHEEVNPRHLAFATLVKSIDGVLVTDLSDDGLRKIVEQLGNAPVAEVDQIVESTKKKIDDELDLYFPQLFDDSAIKEQYDYIKKRAILILDGIIEGRDTDEEADKITTFILTYNKPHTFEGKESIEIAHDKNFENMCLLLSQKLNVDAKKFSVLEYYNSASYLRDEIKAQNKRSKSKRS